MLRFGDILPEIPVSKDDSYGTISDNAYHMRQEAEPDTLRWLFLQILMFFIFADWPQHANFCTH